MAGLWQRNEKAQGADTGSRSLEALTRPPHCFVPWYYSDFSKIVLTLAWKFLCGVLVRRGLAGDTAEASSPGVKRARRYPAQGAVPGVGVNTGKKVGTAPAGHRHLALPT